MKKIRKKRILTFETKKNVNQKEIIYSTGEFIQNKFEILQTVKPKQKELIFRQLKQSAIKNQKISAQEQIKIQKREIELEKRKAEKKNKRKKSESLKAAKKAEKLKERNRNGVSKMVAINNERIIKQMERLNGIVHKKKEQILFSQKRKAKSSNNITTRSSIWTVRKK